jgi:serine/threonine-protein kinase
MSDEDDKTRIAQDTGRTGPGTQLSGIYELDERIASGGMGEVWRGHNIQTGDHVAIKIVLPEFARDQTILSLFRKEASILNHLSHDAVVRYHVFTIDAGIARPYLAMEFVNGPSLYDIMRRGPMPVEDVRRLCHRLTSGLAAVHAAGAVHRDLSPDNVILPDGRVDHAKIIDFGIARSANVGGETLIGGKFAGKYNYVSPEQVGLFGGEVSEQSDIYSLGLVLAAALRGKPIDMSGSQVEVVEKRRVVPDLSDVDEELQPILEAMLQPDPQDRPASMADIARLTREETPPDHDEPTSNRPTTLRDRALGGSPGSIPPRGSTPPKPTSFVPHQPPPHLAQPRAAPKQVVAPPAQPKPSRGGAGLIAAVVALAAIGGGGAYFAGLFGPGAPPPAAEEPKPTQAPVAPQPAETEAALPVQADAGQPAPEPAKAEETTRNAVTEPPAVQPPASDTPPTATPVDEPAGQMANAKAEPPAAAAATPAAEAKPDEKQPEDTAEAGKATEEKPAPVAEEKAAEPVAQPQQETAAKPDTAAVLAPQAGAETAVALNVPKPETPLGDPAERVSWLAGYSGGNCFYAGVTAATDSTMEIEGFGKAVDPFNTLEKAFQSKFHLEPDISVRLIDPSQCEVTGFLRAMEASTAEKPKLRLDRTSVPDGAPISGSLETSGGLISNVLLIDHKGMAFDLDDRIVVQSGRASFSIPIGLGAADKAAGKAVPLVMIVITGPESIHAADFSRPKPATEALGDILKEIKGKEQRFSATAKYFSLGG